MMIFLFSSFLLHTYLNVDSWIFVLFYVYNPIWSLEVSSNWFLYYFDKFTPYHEHFSQTDILTLIFIQSYSVLHIFFCCSTHTELESANPYWVGINKKFLISSIFVIVKTLFALPYMVDFCNSNTELHISVTLTTRLYSWNSVSSSVQAWVKTLAVAHSDWRTNVAANSSGTGHPG